MSTMTAKRNWVSFLVGGGIVVAFVALIVSVWQIYGDKITGLFVVHAVSDEPAGVVTQIEKTESVTGERDRYSVSTTKGQYLIFDDEAIFGGIPPVGSDTRFRVWPDQSHRLCISDSQHCYRVRQPDHDAGTITSVDIVSTQQTTDGVGFTSGGHTIVGVGSSGEDLTKITTTTGVYIVHSLISADFGAKAVVGEWPDGSRRLCIASRKSCYLIR